MNEELRAAITLRRERDDDDAFLRRLHAEFRQVPVADDPVWRPLIDQQFEMQTRHYRSAYPGAEFWIVEDAGVPIGRIYLHETGMGMRLLDITLLRAARGRGIGSMLLGGVISQAASRGLDVTLTVEAANPARGLYERLGFETLDAGGPVVHMVCRAEKPVDTQPIRTPD